MLQRRFEPTEFGFVPKHFVSGDANDSAYRRSANDFMRQAAAFYQAQITVALSREQSTFLVGAPLGSVRDTRCSERRPLPWSKADRFVQLLFEDALACPRAFVAPCRWRFWRKRADSQQHRTLPISELSTALVQFRSWPRPKFAHASWRASEASTQSIGKSFQFGNSSNPTGPERLVHNAFIRHAAKA